MQGIENSCNPVFMDIGLRLGSERFCDYFEQFGLMSLTNIDLPGEAGTIMHKYRITRIFNPLHKSFRSMPSYFMTPDFPVFYDPIPRAGESIV